MSTPATEYLDAINHLPHGATIVFHDVTWDQYDELVQGSATRRMRVSYDRGRLEIMSPSAEHDFCATVFNGLMRIISDELDLEIEAYGSTTWRNKNLGRGAEADASYYIGSAGRLRDRLHIDLEYDPPPDIVVEIDTTHESSRKFSIYAGLRVPEIWHYDGRILQFHALSVDSYQEVPASIAIPSIKSIQLQTVIEDCKTLGQTTALRQFRNSLRRA
jgi:Uma2 family endonuclease